MSFTPGMVLRDRRRMDLSRTLREQGGVVSRRQVLDAHGDDNLIERMIRRNEWKAVHPGVYVDHTGTPTPEQLRMAAVLYAWPAVLAGESALVAYGARVVASTTVRVAIDSTTQGSCAGGCECPSHSRPRRDAPSGTSHLRDSDLKMRHSRRPRDSRHDGRGGCRRRARGPVPAATDHTCHRLRNDVGRQRRLRGRAFLASVARRRGHRGLLRVGAPLPDPSRASARPAACAATGGVHARGPGRLS